MSSIPLDDLPQDFPHHTPSPKFQIGDRVQWHPQPTQDFGTVTGIQYAPAPHLHHWTWKYSIWLDRHSPSRLWVKTDTAWEMDLKFLPIVPQPQVPLENE